ncbi:MAG: NGG1p interacting factor NIF3 [Patescibacteria group bacterium]|nr:NGG1p interacting factor NIF3 [Patescibacteria group bacterium]
MTIGQIYNLAIKMGIASDLRGRPAVIKKLRKEKAKYESLRGEERAEFDTERLINPYSDTRIYYGNPDQPVKRVLAGIDIESAEILMAKELGQKKPIDLIISHHPIGVGLAGLDEVMQMQAEIYALYGVPINIGESLQLKRISEVARSLSAENHNKTVDTARLMDMPLMSMHTATDNLVAKYLDNLFKRQRASLDTVEDLMKLLKTIPEYRIATQLKAGPKLFAGHLDHSLGKIALSEVTGGTSGAKEIFAELSRAGIGTIVGMHMSEKHKEEAEKNHINAVIAGHISSDSIGMNIFLDELEKRGIEIIPCSGLIRYKRYKKPAKRK